MTKEEEREAVEKAIEKTKREMEPQVAKELCILLRIERPYDITTIKEVEEEADYGPGFSKVVRSVQNEILKRDYRRDWRHLRSLTRKVIRYINQIMESKNGTRI